MTIFHAASEVSNLPTHQDYIAFFYRLFNKKRATYESLLS